MAISARNQLAGTVSATERGAFWSARTLRTRRCVRSFATKTAMPYRGFLSVAAFLARYHAAKSAETIGLA